MRGEEGTKVTLVMSRPVKDRRTGSLTDVTFEITREKITYPNIKSEKIGDVGYIRLGQFNAKAADDIKKAVEDLTKQGAKGFVLDLRDNPGRTARPGGRRLFAVRLRRRDRSCR